MSCIFCNLDKEDHILSDELAFAICDKFPVNKGHILVIPKRHFSSLFEATEGEIVSLYRLLDKSKELLDKEFKPDGYNVGVNIGVSAGQSIFHLHIHLIPRYIDDVADGKLKGGIRNFKEPLIKY